MYEKVDFTEFFQKLEKEFPFSKMRLRCIAYCIAISRNFLDRMEKREILHLTEFFPLNHFLKVTILVNTLLSRNCVKNIYE